MAIWIGCAIRREGTVNSTNRLAREWVRAGAPHGAVVVAEKQTEGRGRRGRSWESKPGQSLMLSVIVKPPVTGEALPQIAFAAALAAADAIEALCGIAPFIKWPNDLLIEGRKITGILIEKEGDMAVIGIGINVLQQVEDFSPDVREKAGSLWIATGRTFPKSELETLLLEQLERQIDSYPWLPAYRARCGTIGKTVRVEAIDDTFSGIAEELDETGALLVRDAEGTLRRVLSGDVSIWEG